MTVLALAGAGIDVDRDTARRAAKDELSKAIYHRDDPSWLERVVSAVKDELARLFSRAVNAAPGGRAGLVMLAIVLAIAVVVIAYRVGPVAHAARTTTPLFDAVDLDADAHRRAADGYAATGDYAEAVRQRLRAVVRELEQRGILEPRAGRTADEAAAEAGASLPSHRAALHDAARTFDDIWYGGRPATAAADASLRELDQRLRATRLAVA